MAEAGQTISKLGAFFTKYVPTSMPIFEKKSHPIRPREGLKLCLDFLCNVRITQVVSEEIFFEIWHKLRYIFCKKGPQL